MEWLAGAVAGHRSAIRAGLAWGLGLLLCAPLWASSRDLQRALESGDFSSLSIEALMSIQVVSVSKQLEPLQHAAAAIYVLTGEEMRRAGARNLPEALRLVPGLSVARVDAHTWVVTARGFASTLADKLEVLMDGRSLYTPLFSGVYWDVQDSFLADIDRIEVIRGPGAALWGANAVNGVINIVTRSAADSQGALVSADLGGDGDLKNFAAARYGGRVGTRGHFRVYAKSSDYQAQEMVGSTDANDAWHRRRTGFRTDWRLSATDTLTVQGDAYWGNSRIRSSGLEEEVSGNNLITRWSRIASDGDGFSLQLYYDRTDRDNHFTLAEDRDTYDLDFRHHFSVGERQQWVWGGGYRRSEDEIVNHLPAVLAFTPSSRSTETVNLFVQDQIQLLRERAKLTLGVKVEDNDFTGTELQPSARLTYLPTATQTLWAAVSRAVRMPNRVDHNVRSVLDESPTGIVSGSEDFESEEVIAYELGYRSLLSEHLNLDVALYYNEYEQLRGLDNTPVLRPIPQDPLISNEGSGHGSGIETVLHWHAAQYWTLIAAYTYQDLQFSADSGSSDTFIETNNRRDPRNQALLRSLWDISDRWQLDAALRYVDALPDEGVPAYTELNARLAWLAASDLEFALVGNNLLDRAHPEFDISSGVEISRSIHGIVTWRYSD